MKSKYLILTTCVISVLLLLSFVGDIRAQISCTEDADCDDQLFCTGTETCIDGTCAAVSACPPAIDGCVTRGFSCDEENDMCIDFADDSLCAEGEFCDIYTGDCLQIQIQCTEDADCNDGVFCNGTEFCSEGFCVAVSACQPFIDGCVTRGFSCDEENDMCLDFADNSLCNVGQICDVESGDCVATTFTCGMAQLIVQEAVASGGPYKNHGQMVKTAAHAANPYLYEGAISEECHSCIVSQFARRIPIEQQEVCE